MNQSIVKVVAKIVAEKNSEKKLALLDDLRKLLEDESARLEAAKKSV